MSKMKRHAVNVLHYCGLTRSRILVRRDYILSEVLGSRSNAVKCNRTDQGKKKFRKKSDTNRCSCPDADRLLAADLGKCWHTRTKEQKRKIKPPNLQSLVRPGRIRLTLLKVDLDAVRVVAAVSSRLRLMMLCRLDVLGPRKATASRDLSSRCS